ncbi:MAG: GNAT family N-acetyltransferase [Bacteroidota bacterium]
MIETSKTVAFETERLVIRRLTEHDKENFFLLNGSEEVMRYIRAVKTREESDAHLEQILADETANPAVGKGRWLVEEKATGRFVGSFAIIPIPSEPEKTQLGYSFIQEAWGKGYATEVSKAGLQFFLDNTDVPEIYGVTETANTASMKVLEKAGFRFHSIKMEEGKELTIFIVKRNI